MLLPDPDPKSLPGRYFRLMESGIARVDERMAAEPTTSLQSLESRPGWRRFPSAILAAAVLYTRQHSANTRRGDRRLLILAQRIGDLLAAEHRRGLYNSRQDHHRDTYMWLDAYRLLERELGESRREEWKQALVENLTRLASDVADRKDY